MEIPKEENTQTYLVVDKEYIKLSLTAKGYRWDIKVMDLDIEKLEKLNKEMEEKFGIQET